MNRSVLELNERAKTIRDRAVLVFEHEHAEQDIVLVLGWETNGKIAATIMEWSMPDRPTILVATDTHEDPTEALDSLDESITEEAMK